MTRRPEEALQAQIVTWLRLHGVMVAAVPNAAVRRAGGRAGNAVPGLMAGFPDLLVFPGDGVTVALELKAPPKRLPSGRMSDAKPRISEDQLDVMNKLSQRGISTFVVRSLDQVIDIARAGGWIKGRAI